MRWTNLIVATHAPPFYNQTENHKAIQAALSLRWYGKEINTRSEIISWLPCVSLGNRGLMTNIIFDGPKNASLSVALAHSAGGPMDNPFMAFFAEGLAGRGLRVARFEFPYMVERRTSGKKRPPNTAKVLLETWHQVIAELGAENLVIGGKSMGGRIASMVADEAKVKGLVCLGYPFHPSGKPDKLRIDHLQDLKTPALFLQGDRDSLGNKEDVAGYTVSRKIRLHWLPDGDHGFKPRKKSGRTEQQHWDEALDAFVGFTETL
jgi:predicted alpha/beta-hydrolase family hydrolase